MYGSLEDPYYSSQESERFQKNSRIMGEKRCWRINLALLPIKSHYFFYFGAMGCFIPFLPLLGKSLGINATAVGVIYTILPFTVFMSKPLLGYVTDYFRNIKLIMVILVVITAGSYFFLLIPPIKKEPAKRQQLYVDCSNKTFIVPHVKYNSSCSSNNTDVELTCNFHSTLCDGVDFEKCSPLCDRLKLNVSTTIRSVGNTAYSQENNSQNFLENTSFVVPVIRNSVAVETTDETLIPMLCNCNISELTFECTPDIRRCLSPDKDISVYASFQFWTFTLLYMIVGTATAAAGCLSDSACYEVLGDNPELYGRQRLWATISWGLTTSFSGYLNDVATGHSSRVNYSPAFYLTIGIILVDLIILSRVSITKGNFSKNICGDVSKVFTSVRAVIFAVAVFIIGAFTGLIWNFQFWFLEEMGAGQTLLGLAVAVQCLVAEVPFFYFSGWLIHTFGHFYCVSASFAALALRLGLYYILSNPWWTLPIEVLHGFTYALFYATMTSYAASNAPPGTETTMLGVLGGLFEGLGVATGSLLGGIGFDTLGGRETFLTASIISSICAPLLAVIYTILKKTTHKEHDFSSTTSKTTGIVAYNPEASSHF